MRLYFYIERMDVTKENPYHHSKIYKLLDTLNNYYYLGSTTNSLYKRFHQHKTGSKEQKNANNEAYRYFNSIGWENIKIILIEEYKFENKEQLAREEDTHLQLNRNNPHCLNVRRAFLTEEERQKAHEKRLLSGLPCPAENIKDPYHCVCGSVVTWSANREIHFQTKKHQNFLNQKLKDLDLKISQFLAMFGSE